jgi:anti-anti-sigma regulatory factor
MKLEARNGTLRIAIRSNEDEDIWILEGRLTGQVVDELAATWETGRGKRKSRKSVVDLVDVIFVDERGESVLMRMMAEGARFVVRGVYMKSLIETLAARCDQGA